MRKSFKLFALFFLASIVLPSSAFGLNGNDFPHGRIIDDVVFRNKSSMTVQEIQTFLESKVNGGACDRYRATYNSSYNPPWTCLFEFEQNPTTGANNYGQFNPDGSPASVSGGQSAAQIIWQAGQDYNINPQVLIVLLQKEQGLVTDNWPWTIQYSKATGYNCPDTAPCNPASADFVKQVRGAAWSFNYYIEHLDSYWYGIGSNDILYNPNTACGRKTINIENAATVALYLYTPYTPNQAALDNLYGTGDSCSAYGNRNFWRYFNDWFGSTHNLPYTATLYKKVNASYSGLDSSSDKISTVELWYKNEGSQIWYDETGSSDAPDGVSKVMLYTNKPLGGSSQFGSPAWGTNANVPGRDFSAVYEADGVTLASNQHMAEPGQIVKYIFDVSVYGSIDPGTYRLHFKPSLFQKPNEFNEPVSFVDVEIVPRVTASADYYRYRHQSVVPGDNVEVELWYKNTGNTKWYDQTATEGTNLRKTMLYTAKPIGGTSTFGDTWSNNTVPSPDFSAVYEADGVTLASNQHVANPEQIVKYVVTLSVPMNTPPGKYRNYFQPSLFQKPGVMNDLNSFIDLDVQKPVYAAESYARCCHHTAAPGEVTHSTVSFKNIGNMAWYDQVSIADAPSGTRKVYLYTNKPLGNSSLFGSSWGVNKNVPGYNFSKVYESDGVTLADNQHVVLPDQIVEYDVEFNVPPDMLAGKYRTRFKPSLFRDVRSFNDPTSFIDITVTD